MNSLYLLLGGLALLGLGYFVYGAWLEKVWGVDPSRPTPAHQFRDGVDYMPSKAPVVLGHHFSSIAGAGPINGPIQAAVFGWLPCFIWVVVGGIFFGGVHDFGSLFASLRNKGRSIGEVIAGSIGLRAKRLFVIFSFLTLVLVVGAFASIVAGTFNGFMTDASGALVHNHVNGSTATISLLFIVLAVIFGLLVYRFEMPLGRATLLGVAGCTALLLIGFGIQDSILPIVQKQSGELTHNDLTISLSDEKALTTEGGLADTLDGSSAVNSWGAFYVKSTTIYNEAGESASVSVVGAEDDARMTEYVTFRTRAGHEAIPFDDSSVILTEKTALNLGLEVGDTVYVEDPDGQRVPLTLTGITENYMFTRLYVSNAQLQAYLGGTPEWNTVYGLTGCSTEAEYHTLRTKLLGCNYISSVSFTEDTTSMFDNLIVSLNYVVILVIVCAAALAAVVLYNLISVNLAERKKELATIKVLGFYDKEVYRYIFREIKLLSLIGSGVGLLLGIPLHKFIILTVEMDQLMFIRSIALRSYLLAVALTMLFTLVVCFVMRRHVKRISMVESMKAPE